MNETSIRPAETISATLAIRLPGRAVIAVTGAEAGAFLNGLLTVNIETLPPGEGRPAALLTPQGKMIADMLVFNAQEKESAADANPPPGEEPLYFLDVHAGFADDLVTRLARYRLRAAVEINRLGDAIGVMVVLGASPITGEAFYSFADPRHAALGRRLYGPVEALAEGTHALSAGDEAAYHHLRTRLGIPEGGRDFLPLDTFPHEALLDQLGGVDFKKGCYVGQEVVSRMEHRGTARARALPLRFLNGFGVIGGSEVRAGERLLGRIGESAGDAAIAILRLDRLEEALKAGDVVSAGGVAAAVGRPDFVRFAIPGHS